MATPEGKIQLAIMKYLRSHGVLLWRHEPNTYNHALGRHIANPYAMKGVPDILCIHPDGSGRFLGIEVKTPKGKQSADQVLFQKRCESLGGVYILARSVDDVIKLVVWTQETPTSTITKSGQSP